MWIGVDQLDKAPEIVFQKAHIDNHYPGGGTGWHNRRGADAAVESYLQNCLFFFPELQAFALDWATSNLYVVFRGHRRIFACSSPASDKNHTHDGKSCAELFGNQVAISVGGLALDSNHG